MQTNVVHWFIIQFVQFKLSFSVASPTPVNRIMMNIGVLRFQIFIVSVSMTTTSKRMLHEGEK